MKIPYLQMMFIRLFVLVVFMGSALAQAQITAPEPIEAPVANEWREPIAHFLRELRVKDPTPLVDKTFAFTIGGVRYPQSIALRIEHPTTCSGDVCFTAIGHIADGKFVADAMFGAGKGFTSSDHSVPLFGFEAMAKWFVGEQTMVALFDTPNGWLVIPGATLKEWVTAPDTK